MVKPKRTNVFIFLTVFLFVFATIAHSDVRKFKVATTFTVIADMAKNVAGNVADVVSITKTGAEIHGYQPTPGDIVKLQGTDFVWNGLNLELWFEKFLASARIFQA